MREYDERSGEGAEHQANDADTHKQDRARMIAMHRRHQQRNKAPSEAEKAQAGQFKESMKRKIEGVTTTVAQATTLFQAALLHEKLGEKPSHSTDKLVDIVISVLVSQLGTALKNAVGGGVIGGIVKQSLSIIKSAAKGTHSPGGEMETIYSILSTANVAAERLVDCFKNLVDAMPIEQAASDMRMLSATKAAPGVDDAKDGDGEGAGNVEHGVENQFLESAGAPLTGPAEAEALATAMLREYKAERINYFDTPGGTAGAVQEALADNAPGEIKNAEEHVGLDKPVQADKNERERANDVGNGDM